MIENNEILNILATKAWVGTGYIIVPPDVERVDFIETCFKEETVSLYPDTGGTSFNKAAISREALQSIEFPEEGYRFGSQVVFILHPLHRTPIIIGVLSKKNESAVLGWKEFKISKTTNTNEVTIQGDAKTGVLGISVKSENEVGGIINITIQKPDKKGKFNLEVQGDCGLLCTDFLLENETTRIQSTKKISLGVESFEPAVLGKTMIDSVLNPLIETLLTFKMHTAMGPSGIPLPDVIQKLNQIKGEVEKILSKKVELE